jgi:hypothetical protein
VDIGKKIIIVLACEVKETPIYISNIAVLGIGLWMDDEDQTSNQTIIKPHDSR